MELNENKNTKCQHLRDTAKTGLSRNFLTFRAHIIKEGTFGRNAPQCAIEAL